MEDSTLADDEGLGWKDGQDIAKVGQLGGSQIAGTTCMVLEEGVLDEGLLVE